MTATDMCMQENYVTLVIPKPPIWATLYLIHKHVVRFVVSIVHIISYATLLYT